MKDDHHHEEPKGEDDDKKSNNKSPAELLYALDDSDPDGAKGRLVGGDLMMEQADRIQENSSMAPIPQPQLLRATARTTTAAVGPGAYRGEELVATPDFGILLAPSASAATTTTTGGALSQNREIDSAHNNNLRRGGHDQRGASASNNEERLVEAYAVQEGDNNPTDHLERADPIHPDEEQKQQKQRNSSSMMILWSVVLVVIVAVVVIFGCVVGLNNINSNQKKKSSNNPNFPSTTGVGGPSPTTIYDDQPSSAPGSTLDSLLATLPSSSIARINSGSDTPQWKAWNWLANHPNITSLPEWRQTQLFALATFFYSFEGENWPQPVRQKWMDYTKDECFWYSQGFGYFWDGMYQEWESQFQINPCTAKGEFTTLWLSQLDLWGLSPSFPPEIALLTKLSNLGFGNSGIQQMSLAELLPLDNLHEMTSLTELWLDLNELTGPIPSQIGQLTALSELWLHSNQLSGTLPSQLGQLPSLVQFWLSDNTDIAGQIPSEMGRMRMNLTDVRFNNLQLTGTLPSELGLLTSLSLLDLRGNSLTGSIPTELQASMGLALYGNQFTGIVPNHLCSALRCGSGCGGEDSESIALVSTCKDIVDAPPAWPGRFPTTNNNDDPAMIMLNIHTDGFPEETSWIWQQKKKQQESNNNNTTQEFSWDTLKSSGPLAFPNYVYSTVLPVTPNTTYRVIVEDSWGGGFFGNGWITLTGSNRSVLHSDDGESAFDKIMIEISVGPNAASFGISNSTL